MCILFLAIKQHPDYPVIICANRDEFHQRPTDKMHWWSEPNVLAGKDLQAGGTWLGLNQQGRFSALTNFRQPQSYDPNKQSRGELVLQALSSSTTEMKATLDITAKHYNSFNLIFGQLNNLHCFESVSNSIKPLSAGFHSLCNGALDDIWPKMALGQSQLAETIQHQTLNVERLFDLMRNEQKAPIQQLPHTGVPLDWEQRLSSIFIVSPEYGTRTTNIITLNNQEQVCVYDRNYDPEGQCINKQEFQVNY